MELAYMIDTFANIVLYIKIFVLHNFKCWAEHRFFFIRIFEHLKFVIKERQIFKF